jgi:hypothetical protein
MKILLIALLPLLICCATVPEEPLIPLEDKTDILKSCQKIQEEMKSLRREYHTLKSKKARQNRKNRYVHLYDHIGKIIHCSFPYTPIDHKP